MLVHKLLAATSVLRWSPENGKEEDLQEKEEGIVEEVEECTGHLHGRNKVVIGHL